MPYQLKYRDTLYSEEWVREQYLEKGKSTVEIAKEIDCNRTAVNGALKKFGITARGKISKYDLLRDKEWLKKKYVDEQLTLEEIAEITGSTRGNVGCHLNTMGITLRSISESRLMSDKVNYREGANSNFWKGGIIMTTNANNKPTRKRIKNRSHIMADGKGYISWERYILEDEYGKQLEEIGCQYQGCKIDFVLEVHHRDGDRKNDSPKNLVILCPTHHKAIERKVLKEQYDVRKMVQEKETN